MIQIAMAQDYHLSNYGNMPLLINPAQSGSFLGNQRVGSVYRDQWSQFTSEPFRTLGVYTDLSIDFGLTEGDWIAAGVQVYADQSGELGYLYSTAATSFAYHYAMDGNQNRTLTLGVQYGGSQRQVDLSQATFGDELSGSTGSSNDRNLFNNYSEMSQDLGVGISYRKQSKRGEVYSIGASVQHLLSPEFGDNRTPIRYNLETQGLFKVNSNVWMRPGLYGSLMAEAIAVVIFAAVPFRLDKKSPYLWSPGLGYRVGDALIASLGIDYGQWSFSIAYDVTVSSARVYNSSRGGLELGVSRIFTYYKKPEVTPILLCPRL